MTRAARSRPGSSILRTTVALIFLRRRKTRERAENASAGPDHVVPGDPPGTSVRRALEHLVLALPPKERACVLLKDIFEYSLDEIADLVDSTVGGVKAALSRGRSKLAGLTEVPTKAPSMSPEMRQLLGFYVERFNRRDWDGVRELIRADAQLQVADRFFGNFHQSPYFGNYERRAVPWKLVVGQVDDDPVVVVLVRQGDQWIQHSAVRLEFSGDKIVHAVDYGHCPWVLALAATNVEPIAP